MAPLASAPTSLPGALVISLDFELHWGVRDHVLPDGPYEANLLGARAVIPRLLDLFQAYDIAATWATVGLLFARNREEQERHRPVVLPTYAHPRLSPWEEPVGEDEASDPLHFAPSLIEQIRDTPFQEIGTHTYSHYYCQEPGQTRVTFEADVASAVAAARDLGVVLSSIVLPRNQHVSLYDEVLIRHGLLCFRGRQAGWMHQGVDARANTRLHRAARFVDLHVALSGDLVSPWVGLRQANGLYNIRASAFLRPLVGSPGWLERRREARLHEALEAAARRRGVFHLWWHPHNFGGSPEENLALLERLLDHFARLREAEGMLSLNMRDTAERAREAGA